MKMKWNFKENVSQKEFLYDLAMGGYIGLKTLLADEEQITQLRAAIDLVRSFELAVEKQTKISLTEFIGLREFLVRFNS